MFDINKFARKISDNYAFGLPDTAGLTEALATFAAQVAMGKIMLNEVGQLTRQTNDDFELRSLIIQYVEGTKEETLETAFGKLPPGALETARRVWAEVGARVFGLTVVPTQKVQDEGQVKAGDVFLSRVRHILVRGGEKVALEKAVKAAVQDQADMALTFEEWPAEGSAVHHVRPIAVFYPEGEKLIGYASHVSPGCFYDAAYYEHSLERALDGQEPRRRASGGTGGLTYLYEAKQDLSYPNGFGPWFGVWNNHKQVWHSDIRWECASAAREAADSLNLGLPENARTGTNQQIMQSSMTTFRGTYGYPVVQGPKPHDDRPLPPKARGFTFWEAMKQPLDNPDVRFSMAPALEGPAYVVWDLGTAAPWGLSAAPSGDKEEIFSAVASLNAVWVGWVKDHPEALTVAG